jgi:UDPglucose 6-dehydrogenase
LITVVGLGFVGLTTALGFAERGFKVFACDKNAERMRAYGSGQVPFHEPGLREVLARHLGGNLVLTEGLAAATAQSSIVFFCVGTPATEAGAADLSQLFGAFDELAPALRDGTFRVLTIKSTVPPGTASQHFAAYVAGRGFRVGENVGIASNPEFLREGHAWKDFIEPDRIVIGTSDARSEALLRQVYAPFGAPIRATTLNSSEFIKYLSNSLLATMISFSNEMSMIAHSVGDVDIGNAFRVLHEDKRWHGSPANMSSYVYPGAGYGGYCLPKDTLALHRAAAANGYHARLLGEVIRVNDAIKDFLVTRACTGLDTGATVGLLGLAFKPGSDDVRDSPAAAIIGKLVERGFRRFVAFDPVANAEFARHYDFPLEYVDDVDTVVRRADRIFILTAWPEFRAAAASIRSRPTFDFRYLLA